MRAKGASLKRQNRTRKAVRSQGKYPRVTIFRSNKYFSAQIIDDSKNKTLVSISEKTAKGLTGSKTEKARELGAILAKEAKTKKITQAVFDRGRYAYHGRVKAFAESLREGGLKI